nr:hypothetical protein [Tanacetum cinerariifolium]
MENEDDNVSDNSNEEDENSNERKKRKTISMHEYYCYKMQIRSKVNLLLLGLVDCMTSGEVQPNRIGQRFLLHASFIGGPSDMRRHFLDAMTLVQDDEVLKKLLFKKNILGRVAAYVYVVEFQECGLPHVDFLIIMEPQCKFTNPDNYDKVVCVELPDPRKHPLLYELVLKHMMHGPCGHLRYDISLNGILYSTFQKAALVRGLIESDESLSLCLSEATLFSFPPLLRRLFATTLTFCAQGDVIKLWDDHYEAFFKDYRFR